MGIEKISIPEVHCGNSTPTTDIVKLTFRRSVWLTTLKLNVQQLLSLKSDRNNFTFFGHKHPLLRVNLISAPLVYIGVNIYIRIWFLQTLMGPILYSKDKKHC